MEKLRKFKQDLPPIRAVKITEEMKYSETDWPVELRVFIRKEWKPGNGYAIVLAGVKQMSVQEQWVVIGLNHTVCRMDIGDWVGFNYDNKLSCWDQREMNKMVEVNDV